METTQGTEKSGGKRKRSAASSPAGGKDRSGKKHFEIDIFRGWCKSCGICAAFCPKECISLDELGAPVVSGSERCSGCGWCELHCPDFAISVREKNSEGTRDQDV